jgi:Kae1-associated kinase Bud32
MKIIDSGAEAVISEDNGSIVKNRVEKPYRLKEIDERLRKFRTRREAKVLETLQKIDFPAPRLMNVCDKAMEIRMEMVSGNKLRDVLYQNPITLSEEMGEKIGLLHKNNIIHGDLTTSNMILANEIKFIDFGLSFFSEKVEDKAVDLHLLRQALESKHYDNWQHCFEAAIRGYSRTYPNAEEVLKRLEKVEERGRNKLKH